MSCPKAPRYEVLCVVAVLCVALVLVVFLPRKERVAQPEIPVAEVPYEPAHKGVTVTINKSAQERSVSAEESLFRQYGLTFEGGSNLMPPGE